MAQERRWVLAFDKQTDERVGLTVCDKPQAKFHQSKYELDGYRVEIYTPEELFDSEDNN